MSKIIRAVLLAGYGFVLVAADAATVTTPFTASTTWTAPVGVTSVSVEAWGGGGAGGGVTNNSDAKGGGGAGGQYARRTVAVVPGNNYAIVVGNGGAGSTGSGTAGGDSSFGGSSVVAKGGAGGTGGGSTNNAGAAGSATGGVGTLVYAGGSGSAGTGSTGVGGAGGGGAGSGGAGGNASGDTAGTGTATGGGAGGAGLTSRGTGNSGNTYGGGGGGGYATTNTDRPGGDGADGRVVLTYTAPPEVSSIVRASPNPTVGASSVQWTVTFSASVTGVDTGDFSLVQSGVSGAALTSVAGSGTTWTVTASTGSGTGTLGLNLVDNDSIIDADPLPLGGAGAGNGNFTGEVYSVTPTFCSPPANAPSGLSLSCVCDTFNRATLNPSTIFNSNWIVSTSDSTGILPRIVNSGYLRLTEDSNDNAKAATVPGIFPAAGNYISVEFQLYAYHPSGTGADGIAVTLSDYSVPAVPGAYGGSLGYAQKTGISGFAGGWLGVALDEYGNYQNPTEGRVGGPGFRVDSVGARGSGSGTTGYRWLGGTTTLAPGIDNASSSSPAPGHTYQVIVDARSEPTSTAVAVNRDTGSGYASLISIPNVYAAATAQGFTQDPVPANWQVSFTGSTGGSTNYHEIGSLRICAQTVYPPTGGAASGFNAIDEAYGTPPIAVQNYLTGHIYTKLVGVPFKLNVAALNNNQIQTTYVVSGTKNVTVNLVDNSDNVCVLDSSQANYCSAACKAKTAVSGGSQVMSFAPSNAGQKQSANFTLNTAYSKLAAIITDGTTTACATDMFSVRPQSVTSVTSSNATNATTGGAPIFKAGADGFNLAAVTAGVAGNASGYTGVLKINNSVLQAVSPATVGGVVAPATFPAAVSGSGSSSASGSTFTYSEVGAFLLPGYDPASNTASPRGVYDGVQTVSECAALTSAQCDSLRLTTSWTGIDGVSTAGDCVLDSYSNTKNAAGKYGCNFGSISNTAGIGRFIPNEFRVSSASLTNRQALACVPASAFSYLDEPMALSFTLEAWSGAGTITRNYAGALAKLAVTPSATSIASLALGAAASVPSFTALSSRLVPTGFAGAWPAFGAADAGTVALSGTVAVSSLSTPSNNRVSPDGPFNTAAVGIAPVDSDGVRVLAYDLDADNSGGVAGPDHKSLGSTTLYFGQLRLLPAYGSERQSLSVGAEVLRWNGTAFVPNGSDNCTNLPVANQGLRDYARNLNSGETSITSGAMAITGGKGRIVLSAPGNGNNGSVNVWADLTSAGLSYLAGRWPALPGVTDATPAKYDNPPWATATFGIYKGQWIDMRENFFY